MAEEKKTQMGTTPARTARPTGSPPIASAVGTMPAASGTPAPTESLRPAATEKPKTSYLPETVDPLLGANILDRYKIVRKLGEGGMGAVYLAMHTVLEKQVALKVLHGEFARKADLVERFMQEAKAASRIRHVNVIDISDFGQTPDGLVFFAMELLKGHDLHEEITRAKLAGNLLPWSRTKKIFLQVCSALTAAHARGIIHRDLKPENIYLVEFLGEPDFVKLLDFGIAKVTDVAGSEEGARKLTKTGMLFGTPEYMSPEQARGEKVDHRVDIYAMGCILFQLITNQVPFQAENFMGMLAQHLTADPPQLSPAVLDQIGAPRAIAEIVDKTLTKDPNTRWQTIEELANAIREACGDAPADSVAMRAASVPGVSGATRKRTPTGPARSGATTEGNAVTLLPSPAVSMTSAGRSRTAWTGNLTVPEVAEEAPKTRGKSKLPLILGAVILVGGGIAAAVVALGGKDNNAGQGSAVAAGSGSAVGSGSAGTVVPQPPPPPPEPALPAMVTIKFTSTPDNALVVDAADPTRTYGKTPTQTQVPGSKDLRRFKYVLKGYGEATVEVIPDRATIELSQPLVKGGKATTAVVARPDPNAGKPGTGSGSATVTTTKPDPGAGSGSAKPDPKRDPKPDPKPDPGGVQQPGGSGEKKPDCPDPDDPCLKSFP